MTGRPITREEAASAHEFALLAAWTWLVIGIAAAIAMAAAWRTAYGSLALIPWAICQAVERVVAYRIRKGAIFGDPGKKADEA